MSNVERVGVVPRPLAEDLGLLHHGYTRLPEADLIADVEAGLGFADRPEAEVDPSQKQIIPYGVVVRGDRVFTVERLTGGGEARLHGKVSIGIGGHVNPENGAQATAGILHRTMLRELDEELHLSEAPTGVTPMGLINDDSTDVGSVHLGLVYRVELADSCNTRVRESDTLQGGFRSLEELRELVPRMESWSAFVVDALQDFTDA